MSAFDSDDASCNSGSVNFAPVEEASSLGGESPFHNDSSATFPSELSDNAHASTTSDSSAMSMSLLERIQQQKKSLPPGFETNHQSLPFVEPEVPASENGNSFNYPMAEETNYSSASAQGTVSNEQVTTAANLNIPNYSTPSMAPNPYDESSSTGFDYKGQMVNVLSAVGGATIFAAKGAYRGTKFLYNKATSKGSGTNAAGNISADRRAEMDYQRESLLMDPHDAEDFSSAGGFSSPSTAGLRGGIDGPDASVAEQDGYSIIAYFKQFCVDIKDIFLAAPRKAQIAVIALAVLIIWLFISEEL